MNLTEGALLGQYRIGPCIGRGGMATVYKAVHTGLDREVAIKVLPDYFAQDESYQERFQQEARSVARLKHPNIVSVFDYGQQNGVTFLVLELVEGGTLADRLLGSPMDLEDVVHLLEPLANALDYAHLHGIVHRDVKPSNVLLQKDGTPMLADFGLVRMADTVRRITAAGIVMGTPEYMSPEQGAGEMIGPASDRYSLAVMAYEMLTGRVPFKGDTPAAVLVSHMSKAMPPTRELRGELSGHVEEALRQGLAKSPAERFPTAAMFVVALTPAAWPERTRETAPTPEPRTPRQGTARTPIVMVVDDGAANRELIEACLAGVDCDVRTAPDGPTALSMIEKCTPDLVLLDVQMPGMDGYEVCRRIKANPGSRLVPVVMITSLDRTSDRVQALESGADDYMSKPVERVELVARVRSALRLKSVYDSLDRAEQVIFSLAAAVEAKDPFTEAHTERVAESARRVGVRLGLSDAELDALYRGGLIHDIGKIGVPDAILLKKGRLDGDELVRMRAHPVIGESIVAPLRSGADLLPIIRHHHERFDGSGYPDGLRGHQIPRLAGIVAVCDAYDAMVNDRPYRPRRSIDEAIAILSSGAGTQWDRTVVDAFMGEIPDLRGLGAAS